MGFSDLLLQSLVLVLENLHLDGTRTPEGKGLAKIQNQTDCMLTHQPAPSSKTEHMKVKKAHLWSH